MKYRILLFFLLSSFFLPAQQIKRLATDSTITHAQLENGLSYYIIPQPLEKEDSSIYMALIQEVGINMEDSSQIGSFYLTSHLLNQDKAFQNLRERLKEDTISFLKQKKIVPLHSLFQKSTIGNDYSCFEMQMPQVMDTILLQEAFNVMYHWSNKLVIDKNTWEKEKRSFVNNVCNSDSILRATQTLEISKEELKALMPESYYAKRCWDVEKSTLSSLSYESYQQFYQQWFQPQWQAIIMIGKIENVKKLEQIFKKIFCKKIAQKNLDLSIYHQIPQQSLPLISSINNKVINRCQLHLYYKHDKLPKHLYNSYLGLVKDYIQRLSETLISQRINGLYKTLSTNKTHKNIQVRDTNYLVSHHKEAITITLPFDFSELDSTIIKCVHTMNQIRIKGFTNEEYEKAKQLTLDSYEQGLSSSFSTEEKIKQIGHSFIDGRYLIPSSLLYKLFKELSQEIPLSQINQYVQDILELEDVALRLQYPTGITPVDETELLKLYFKGKQ